MTMIQKSIPTTIAIRHGANIVLGTSYDYQGLGDSILPAHLILQSLIDQAVEQWWSGLTVYQRSVPNVRLLSLKISASYQHPPKEH
jgi:hypothetical protein